MSILTVFLYALVVVLALLLIGIVLIQPAKSGGMGAAFGGIGESVFGAKAGSHLTKATVIMTTLFFALALALAVIIGRGWYKSKSGVSTKLDEESKKAVAAPASNKSAVPAQTKNVPAQPKKTVAAPASNKSAVPAQKKSAVPAQKKNVPAQPKKTVAVPAQQKKPVAAPEGKNIPAK